jgi:hypothetical protein
MVILLKKKNHTIKTVNLSSAALINLQHVFTHDPLSSLIKKSSNFFDFDVYYCVNKTSNLASAALINP